MRGARGHRKERRRESKVQPDNARTDGGKRGGRGYRRSRERRRGRGRGRGSSGGGEVGVSGWAQLSLCIPSRLVPDPTLCSWPPRLLPFGPCPLLLTSRRWPARQVRRRCAARRIAPSTGPEPDVGTATAIHGGIHSPSRAHHLLVAHTHTQPGRLSPSHPRQFEAHDATTHRRETTEDARLRSRRREGGKRAGRARAVERRRCAGGDDDDGLDAAVRLPAFWRELVSSSDERRSRKEAERGQLAALDSRRWQAI